jgi:phenylalanyl-tRNA synthetase beta chain
VRVRLGRAERILGFKLAKDEAETVLQRLGFAFVASEDDGYAVTPPAFRFDIAIEEDLIEELARVHGYDRIPAAVPLARAACLPAPEATRSRAQVRNRAVLRDYHEVVTYSFIDRRWEEELCGSNEPVSLANPIASQMSVMRSSLIPGLVMSAAFNVRHRQSRVRLFEIGRCFARSGDGYAQPIRVGAVAYGDALPEQWGTSARRVDFYDVKGDLEAFFAPAAAQVEVAEHPAFHPGKSGRIVVEGNAAGWIGELHPRWQQKYDLPQPAILLEVDFDALVRAPIPVYGGLPKVPPVRRDLAALFDEATPHAAVVEVLRRAAPPIVSDIRLFDVYRGRDLEKGKKSLAFMVLLQDTRKTLTDSEVESALAHLRETLLERFDARLR